MNCFKLNATDEELKNILLSKGAEKFTSHVYSVLENKLKEFHSLPDFDRKEIYTEKFNNFMHLRILHNIIFNNTNHSNTDPSSNIKKWRYLLLEMNFHEINNKHIRFFSELWVDKNAAIDSETLQYVCRSLYLLSTCFFCQHSNFHGNKDYTQARFTNCLGGVTNESATFEDCHSFERREVTDE